MVENVMHSTSEYEERLRRCQYVPRLSFGRRMLRDDGAPNRFFLTLARYVPFFLITHQHSLFSIHSSCKFIRTILILTLDLVLFFFNNIPPTKQIFPYVSEIGAIFFSNNLSPLALFHSFLVQIHSYKTHHL